MENCRKTLYFYNKIREVLCEFVAEEELEQSCEQDSIIVPVRHNVVFDDNNLLEGITNAFERIQFLLTFFFGFYLVGRLNIVLLVPISSNEIYLILFVFRLAIDHFTVFNDSHIHHITTVQQFIEDDVLHQMRLLQLAVIQPCVSKTDIYRVVFLDVLVILVALDIITSGFVEQE